MLDRIQTLRIAGFVTGGMMLCGVAAPAAQATVLFDPGDLGQFTLNGSHTADIAITPAVGVGGSSGLISTGGFDSYATGSAVFTAGLPMMIGQTYSVSLFYQMALQGSGPDLRLGFLTSTAGLLDDNPPPHVWFETFGSLNPKRSGLDGTYGDDDGPNPVMTPGNWFRLELTLRNLDGTNLAVQATVDDYGASGTAFVANRLTQGFMIADAGIGGAPTLYGGFAAHVETPALDNFMFGRAATDIPEPGTLALFGLGLAGLAAARRRKTA